ncbi:hypothetical protein [[Clostridium] scindens]|nr:hypothetical protein [[Clostridium] scindens]
MAAMTPQPIGIPGCRKRAGRFRRIMEHMIIHTGVKCKYISGRDGEPCP